MKRKRLISLVTLFVYVITILGFGTYTTNAADTYPTDLAKIGTYTIVDHSYLGEIDGKYTWSVKVHYYRPERIFDTFKYNLKGVKTDDSSWDYDPGQAKRAVQGKNDRPPVYTVPKVVGISDITGLVTGLKNTLGGEAANGTLSANLNLVGSESYLYHMARHRDSGDCYNAQTAANIYVTHDEYYSRQTYSGLVTKPIPTVPGELQINYLEKGTDHSIKSYNTMKFANVYNGLTITDAMINTYKSPTISSDGIVYEKPVVATSPLPTLTKTNSKGQVTIEYTKKISTTGNLAIEYIDRDTKAVIKTDNKNNLTIVPDLVITPAYLKPFTPDYISSNNVMYELDNFNPYELPLPTLSINNPNGTVRIRYIKPVGAGTLKIKYINKSTGTSITNVNGQTIPDAQIIASLATGNHTFTSGEVDPYKIAIDGYTFSDYSPSTLPTVSMASSTATLLIRYTPTPPIEGTGKVNIRYVDEANVDISTLSTFNNVSVGSHTYTAIPIDGYITPLVPTQTIIVESGQIYDVKFVYTGNGTTTTSYPPPIANFLMPSDEYEGNPVFINDISTAAPGCKIDHWVWSSTDPENVAATIGDRPNGTVIFMNAGTYTVYLTVHQSPIDSSQPVQLVNGGWSKIVAKIFGGKK